MGEMLSKVDEKVISASSFIWAEGMTDWKLMREIPAFEGIDKKIALISSPQKEKAQPTPPQMKEEPTGPIDVASIKAVALELDMTPLKAASERPANTAEVEKAWKRRRLIRRSIKTAVAVAIIGGGTFAYNRGVVDQYIDTSSIKAKVQILSATMMDRARPHLLSLADKYPVLSGVISPIPHLKDVSAEDYERLRLAASGHLDKGPLVAVAQSTSDPQHPFFYVSSNLPDGAKFDVYLEGMSETLVGKIHSSAKVSVTIQRNLGKSDGIALPQNAQLPMGEYQVSATESDGQPESVSGILKTLPPLNAAKTDRLPAGLKLLARRTYFLGGTKDEAYNQKLQAYHAQLQQKARIELADLNDIGATLEKQIQSTTQQFKSIKKGKGLTAGKKRAWSTFHADWIKNEIAWQDRFSKITPDALRDDYVYAEQYDLARQAGQELQKLHDLQNDYFEGRLDERGVDIQLGTATSVVESAFMAFRTKTEQAEKASATSSMNQSPKTSGGAT